MAALHASLTEQRSATHLPTQMGPRHERAREVRGRGGSSRLHRCSGASGRPRHHDSPTRGIRGGRRSPRTDAGHRARGDGESVAHPCAVARQRCAATACRTIRAAHPWASEVPEHDATRVRCVHGPARGPAPTFTETVEESVEETNRLFRERVRIEMPERSFEDVDKYLGREARKTLLDTDGLGMDDIDEALRQRVRRSPGRFRVHALQAGLLQVFSFAAAYSDRVPTHWASLLGPPRRNDLADINIAASAAVGTRLVRRPIETV